MLLVALLAVVPIVANVVSASGATPPRGPAYWLAGADGGVFTFGDAPFAGSAGGHPLNASTVGMAITPSGMGYWLAAADGGVFAFGDASFQGAASKGRLNAPIVGIAATPSGDGYWLAAADGGVFAFGDATYAGAASKRKLNAPIVGIAATPSGDGYWLAAADGGVFAFGDATYAGSASGHHLNAPIVSISRTWNGAGYWLASEDGGVFAYGNASYYGSSASRALRGPIVAVASGLAPARPAKPTALTSSHGYDISWPQCGSSYPTVDVAFGIVGVTGGKAFTTNPCLSDEAAWSQSGGHAAGVYMNLNAPDLSDAADPAFAARTGHGPEGACAPGDAGCVLGNFGAAAANAAWATASAHGISAPMWWLDVETANTWSPNLALNRRVIRAAVRALRHRGVAVGIYSTAYQWEAITGGLQLGLPVWVAGAPDPVSAAAWCDGRGSFNGGPTWLVQALPNAYDEDAACGPVLGASTGAFTTPAAVQVPIVAPGTAISDRAT